MSEHFSPEKEVSKEDYSSRIILHFFRHGEKEADPEKTDEKIELTPRGKKQAAAKSESGDISQSVAFGSPRKRTQETAGFVMGGQLNEVTGEETLEELVAKLNQGRKVGSKIGIDPLLDFTVDEHTPFGGKVSEAIKNGRYLSFLIQESDILAKEFGDTKSTTYSRAAANIAKVIEKYLRIASRWEAIVEDPKKEYKDTLERFLGTHQGNTESFLAKAIELTKGVEERDKFMNALGGRGFAYVEGANIEILNHGDGKPTIKVSYRNETDSENPFVFEEIIDSELLEKIIRAVE